MLRIIKNLLLATAFIMILSSCSTTLNFNNLNYDNDLGLYEYLIDENSSIFPRNEVNQLINKINIDSFYTELEKKEFKYSFDESFENDNLLKFNDFKIAKLYSEINKHIVSKEFNSALNKTKQLELIYPDISKYSDLLFLKAIAFEQIDSLEQARNNYSDFLNYCAGKYSKRFRGYRDSDISDSIWGLQRRYAKENLNYLSVDDYSKFLTEIIPKYHYNSFQPGFLLNPEDYSRGVKWVTMLVFGTNYSNQVGIGYQVNRKLKSNLDLNVYPHICLIYYL